ncbi:MAG: hypothetical protein ACK5PF_12005, partial [bacterium]
ERLIPKLNAWLAKVFPPKAADDDGFTPVIGAGPLEEAHALIGKIVITVASDGTLKASAPCSCDSSPRTRPTTSSTGPSSPALARFTP